MFRFLFALLFSALLTTPLSAQTAGGKGLQVRLLAERTPKDLGAVVLVAGEKTSDPFVLPVNHVSEPIKAPARSFGLKPADAATELAKVELPEEGDQFIVLLLPSKEGGYESVVIPAVNEKFKIGDVYFHNHSNKGVMGYVGDARFALLPGKGTFLRPKGPVNGKYYNVGFGVREETGDRTISKTRWPIDKGIRSYIFFFVNPETGKVTYRAIDEPVTPSPQGA